MADMKLVDGGAHSVGVNNDNDRQYVSATPKGTLTSVVEFTNVGGVLGQPTVQNASSGLISAGTELWFKNSGSNTLVRTEVGGVSESGTPVTWNPSDKGSSTTLSNGNLTAYVPAANGGVRTTAYLTGKKYWEVHIDSGAVSTGYGVATASWSLSTYCGGDEYSWAVYATGVRYHNASDVGTVSAIAPAVGATLMFAYDASAGKLWIGKNGSWYGDPAAGTGEAFSGISGNIYPAIGSAASGTTVTANFGSSSFEYSVPSGFSAATQPITYTLSSLTPALTGAIGDWTAAYKIRSDKTKPLMYLAMGQTDEPLVKETALTLAGSGTSTTQVVTTQASSLLSYFATGNLSKDIVITVGGVDSVVQPNGEVTETGSGPYTTTIPIATQASAPTAAKLANRFTTAVAIGTVVYVTGPELDITGEATTLTDDPTLKRLALKVRGDTALGIRSKDWMIETTEKAG